MDGYKHYIRVENGIVIHGFSNAFEQPQSDDIQLSGDFGRHFQFNLLTDRLQFKYKIINGQMIERTQTELDAEWNARPPAPKTPEQKEVDKLKADNASLNDQIVDLWETLINSGVL